MTSSIWTEFPLWKLIAHPDLLNMTPREIREKHARVNGYEVCACCGVKKPCPKEAAR